LIIFPLPLRRRQRETSQSRKGETVESFLLSALSAESKNIHLPRRP
jgi:hypothetical protein